MKEQITKFDLSDAFKALDDITIPSVRGIRANRMDLHESTKRIDRTSMLVEDYYNIQDTADMEEAQDERQAEINAAKLARIEKIVDLDANSADELLPSYVGKTIIQCPQCMTLFYKDPADIERDAEDINTVNVGEICQHCGNDSGYTLIGKVAEEEVPVEVAAEEVPAEPEEAPEEASEDVEEVPEVEEAEETEELPEIPEEELAVEESVNRAKANQGKMDTEYHSENLTLNEEQQLDEVKTAKNIKYNTYTEIMWALTGGKKIKDEQGRTRLSGGYYNVADTGINYDKNIITVYADSEEGLQPAVDIANKFGKAVSKITFDKYLQGDKKYKLSIQLDTADFEDGEFEESVNKAKANKGEMDTEYHSENLAINEAKDLSLVPGTAANVLKTNLSDINNICGPKSEASTVEAADFIINLLKKQAKDTEAVRRTITEFERNKTANKAVILQHVYNVILGGNNLYADPDKKWRNRINCSLDSDTSTEQELVEDLNKDMDQYNTYIKYLQNMLAQDEAALERAKKMKDNEFAVKVIEKRIAADKEDLEAALPDIVKAKADQEATELPEVEETQDEVSVAEALEESINRAEANKGKMDTEYHSENLTINEAADFNFTGDVSDAELDELFGSKEFNTPITDAEVRNYLESVKNEAQNVEAMLETVEGFDDEEFDAYMTECLTDTYENVKSFKSSACTFDTNKNIIVEGVITFNSGKQKASTFDFTVASDTKSKKSFILEGLNKDIADEPAFKVYTAFNEDKKTLTPVGIDYSYKINNTLVEGWAGYNLKK